MDTPIVTLDGAAPVPDAQGTVFRPLYQTFDFPEFTAAGETPSPLKWGNLCAGVDFKGKTVLDAGCCDGYFCFKAAAAGAAFVTGVDSDPCRIARATALRGKFPQFQQNLEFIQSDLFSVTRKAQYVFVLSVSHHVSLFRMLTWAAQTATEKAFFEIMADMEIREPFGEYYFSLVERPFIEEILPSMNSLVRLLSKFFKEVDIKEFDRPENNRFCRIQAVCTK